RFGENFSDVRIYTGHRAAEAADSVQARAFTVGEDVVFAEGQFAPETTKGQRLLAHELAHVVQQRQPAGPIAREGEAERDAREAAREVAGGGTPSVHERAEPGTVQKQEPGQEEPEAGGKQISTSKPRVSTGTSPIHTEASTVFVKVEGRTVAAGQVG